MKAVVYDAPGKLTYKEVQETDPGSGEVKLQVMACGICGSDVQGYMGHTGRRIAPMVMGHEFAGEIIAVGENVREQRIGDRVSVYPVDFCGKCEMCRKGDMHLCLNKRAFGILKVDGALADTICVPEKCCFSLMNQIPYAVGALMEPLAVSYRGISHAGDLEGKTVLIVGAGTIGLLALACVRRQKPAKILVSDLSGQRLETAEKMGADVMINPGVCSCKAVIDRETGGRGVDVAIEAVGIQTTVQQAMASLAFGGTAVWIGNNKPLIEINMQEIVTREITVYGSFLYGYDEFREVAELVNQNILQITSLISKEIKLSEVPEYFDILANAPGDLIKVVVTA